MNAPKHQRPPQLKKRTHGEQRPCPPQPKAKLKKRSKSAKPGWLWFVFALAGIAFVSATAGALLAVTLTSTPLMQRKLSAQDASIFTKGDRISTSGNLQLPELTRPVNVLVLGVKVTVSDLSGNVPPEAAKAKYDALVNSFDGLTDTMLLLRFNPDQKRLTVMSIPRDTRTLIPGYSVSKINEAHKLGGPALAARATSELLGGVGIDRYVVINVQGVQALVDALGGVNVYVPKDMKYQDDSQHLYVNLKAGQQHLTGDQALQLLRFRHDELGDIGRIQRQQMVMRALMEQSLNPATIARIPKLLSVLQSHVDTNLSVEELVALTGFASRTNRSQVQMLTVPGTYSDPSEYDASYWLPQPDRITTMMAKYFDFGTALTTTNQPGQVRVIVQDSTRQPGVAQALVNKLQTAGYTSVAIDPNFKEPLRMTRIVAQKGDSDSAQAIYQALGFGEVRVESTGDMDSDVTIQLGQDWVQRMAKPGQ